MIYKLFLTILFSLLSVITSFGQQPVRINPGIISDSKPALTRKLDSIFSSFNKTTPGVAVTVLQNGKILAKRSYGLASLEHKVPFKHNSVVRLGYSEGREFMVIAAVLMENAGILKLSDKIRKYFPQLPSWAEDVEILDIINHRSGLADEWDAFLLTQASMGNRVDVSQFLQMLYNQPKPEVEPRKGYMYSNSDYGLLRLIMEKASGEDLGAWMENDSLKVKQDFAPIIRLEYISQNVFKAVGLDVYFEFHPTANGLLLKTHVYPASKVYTHIKADIVSWKPSKDLLASLTGKYYSKHLDYYWTIIEDGEGNLIIKRPTIADTKIKPERENIFLIEIEEFSHRESPTIGRIRFYTDSSGAVTHLTVSHPRLMHHRFDRL